MKKFKTIIVTSLVTIVIASLAFTYFYYKNVHSKTNSNSIQISQEDSLNDDFRVITTQQRQQANNEIFNSRQNIITATVKEASPAVVGINVTEIRQYRDPWSSMFENDPVFRRFFGDRVYNRKVKGLGSGAIISPDGYIITNDHVAGNGVEIIVTMTNGTQYDAKIVGSDLVSDICLLKIEAENLPYLKFGDSDDILIGEWCIALGNPFGLFEINDKPTVTVGVISAVGMNLGAVNDRYYLNMIQTDAAINGGNSGGPLVNSIGELIGMNTLIYTAGGSSGNIGVGFALPVNKIKNLIGELKANGQIDRDFWTGLRIQTVDEGIAKYYELSNTRGVIVTYVENKSPADKAGLEVGDVVLEVEGYKINDDNTMISVLHEFRTGEQINFKILRNDKIYNKQMKLEKRND